MINHFKNLFEYENWSNKEIIESIIKINNPNRKILSLMSHIMNAQILWLSRIQSKIPEAKVWQLYEKLELDKVQKEAELKINDYLRSLNENDLDKIVNYTNTKGENFQSTVKDILIHLTHHSAYHRGQVVLLLKDYTPDLPYTDYIHFVRSIKK